VHSEQPGASGEAGYASAVRGLGDDIAPGVRVKVVRDPGWNGRWPAEPEGVIHPDADCRVRVIDLPEMPEVQVDAEDRRAMSEFMVLFDEPQIDGDGAGPYYAAVIWEKYLRLAD